MDPTIELLSTGLNVDGLPYLHRVAVIANPIQALSLAGALSLRVLDVFDNPSLASVDLPVLKTFVGAPFYSLGIARNPVLTTISANALVSAVGSVDFNTNVALINISLNALVFVSGYFSIAECASLSSLSLPALIQQGTLSNFYAGNCASLTTFNAPKWLPTNGRQLLFNGCALNATSVDHILARCVANPGFVSGIVNLSGGTSAAPGAQGQLDKATLIARGVTVTTN